MALVTQSSLTPNDASLAPFTGVNNGSARLLKAISATELALLQEGDLVYVISVRDYWKWLPTSTITSDDITYCAPTVVGVGAGRFERMMFASPDWMLQTTWVMDDAGSLGTSNDENDGLTAATALRTDTERQRRMGEEPIWSQTEYHLRYLSDVPNTRDVVIRNRTRPGAQIFLHSSMTNGAGQSTLFSGTAGTITALNYAAPGGGQPWEMICATIPVSWTASGLLNKRLRFTSGANLNGIVWIIKDLGGVPPAAKARLNEPQTAITMTAPIAPSANSFTPVAGDTFVIEKLTLIPLLTVDTTGGISGTVVNGVILDSIDVGTTGRCVLTGNRTVVRYGSTLGTGENQIMAPALQDYGCQFSSAVTHRASNWFMTNCYQMVACNFHTQYGGTIRRHMQQGNATGRFSCGSTGNMTGVNLGWIIEQLGAFDNATGNSIMVLDRLQLTATATLWGVNTANLAPIIIARGGIFNFGAAFAALPASYFYIQPCPGGADVGAWVVCALNGFRANVPAYDDTTQLFTANRLLSPANIQATVGAGGFGGQFFDPFTGCQMGQG